MLKSRLSAVLEAIDKLAHRQVVLGSKLVLVYVIEELLSHDRVGLYKFVDPLRILITCFLKLFVVIEYFVGRKKQNPKLVLQSY